MKEEDDSQYILLEAQDSLNQKNYEHCIALCKPVLAKEPDNVNATILSAICFHLLHQHQIAIELFEKFPVVTKSQAASWRWYALAISNAGFLDKAEIEFKQLISAYPDDLDVCHSYGHFMVFIKKYAEGLIWLNKAVASDYIDHSMYFNRGVAHYNLQNYEEAIADMEKTLELEPENAEAANALAEIYKIKGEHDKAIEYYSRAMYYAPNNRKIRFSRLLYLVNLKDEYGNISNHEMAQQDADKLTPYIHEFITITSKEGLPMKPIKIKITETCSMNFEC